MKKANHIVKQTV